VAAFFFVNRAEKVVQLTDLQVISKPGSGLILN